jgi:hypothetical protein
MRFLFLMLVFVGGSHVLAIDTPAEKLLSISVTENGLIKSGADTIPLDKLAMDIKNRLFKSWLSGKNYTRITLSYSPGLRDAVTGPVLQEIKEGQRLALIAVCLEKYRKRFDDLDAKEQDKLRKKTPVLFQTEYT